MSPTLRRIAIVIALLLAGLLAIEFLIYELALVLFTHLDSPDCPGSNTFCSPGGGAAPTGGTVVVLIGNAALAVVVIVAVLVARRAAGQWGRINRGRRSPRRAAAPRDH